VSTTALDSLVRSLHEEFQGKARGTRIGELLGDYARAQSDWREFALTSAHCYTRNLVAREEHFELMILCWGAGQESPIHNHEGQDCWMAVLEGEMEEVRFPTPNSGARGSIHSKATLVWGPGQVAFIRDEMGLHLVRPSPASAYGGSTLHLYASPYDECDCYCPETGLVTRKRLGHYSIRGQLLFPPTRV